MNFLNTLYLSILSYPILSYPILSYPILSYPILSYPILSYPILSYPVYLSVCLPIISCPILEHNFFGHLKGILPSDMWSSIWTYATQWTWFRFRRLWKLHLRPQNCRFSSVHLLVQGFLIFSCRRSDNIVWPALLQPSYACVVEIGKSCSCWISPTCSVFVDHEVWCWGAESGRRLCWNDAGSREAWHTSLTSS